MWFFGTKGNPRLSRTVSEHEERLEKLERHQRMADLEYNEFYDKVRHAMGRMAKRSAIIEKAQQEEDGADPAATGEEPSTLTDGLEGLTARQRQINQQILAGRMRRQ